MEQLTTSEALLMKCIWSIKGDVPLAILGEEMERRFQKKWKRTTIRTFITHMENKKYIRIYSKGKYSFVEILIDEERYREEQMRLMRELWFDGSAVKMVSAMCQDGTFDEETRNELRKLLSEMDELQ